jgi:hypothetical protein
VRTVHLNVKTGNVGAGILYQFDDAAADGLTNGQLTAVTGTTDHLMVSFFRDAGDEEYFMVVNKHNARDPHGDETHLLHNVTLTFTDDVGGIRHLSRHTGRVESLSLEDHRYTFSLPGGTGDLFNYRTDKPFVGAEE